MTSSPPDTETTDGGDVDAEEAPHPLAEYAERVAEAVGGDARITYDTIKVTVPADRWVEVLTIARDELDLVSFSFVSAIDWTNDVAVGNPLEEELEEESFEILATVGDLSEGRRVTFSASIPHAAPAIDSLVDVFWGANWHERETHEMFGIDFVGHPDLSKLYLPEHFVGNPLLKSFPLLSREVKPWPGKVDVEDMPETDEAEDDEAEDDEAEDDEAGGETDAEADGEESAGEAETAEGDTAEADDAGVDDAAEAETAEAETAEAETAEAETAEGETAEGETAEGETAEGDDAGEDDAGEEES